MDEHNPKKDPLLISRHTKFDLVAIAQKPGWVRIKTHRGAVAFPVWNGKIGMVVEKRWVNDQWMQSMEIPRGGAHEDETLEQAALRECQEELGIHIHRHRTSQLCTVEPDNGIICSQGHVFVIHIDEAQTLTQPNEEDCIIDRMWLTPEEVLQKIKNHEIMDSFTLAAILHWRLNNSQ